MNINHIKEKIKETLSRCEKRDIYTPIVIILACISAFFLGKIGTIEAGKPTVLIETVNMPKCPAEPAVPTSKPPPKPKKPAKKKTTPPAIIKP